MALVSKSISNLIGGVSQQPDAIRFDNQCDAQDNAYPSVLDGLTKRPPTEHVGNLGSVGATATITITDYTKLNTGDKVNLIATDGTNHDFTVGDQSSVDGTWEATTSNAVTAFNLMNVINTSSNPDVGTRFTATQAGAIVTATQATEGNAGNTTVTLTDPLDGMSKTDFTTAADEDYFVHTINRDPLERYVLTIKSDHTKADIKIHDLNGVSKNIYDGAGTTDSPVTTYLQMALSSDSADTQLRAITIADYTFIVNRTKAVEMKSDTETARAPEALFFVAQGDYGTNYKAEVVKGVAAYSTSVLTPDGGTATDRDDIATDVIADALYDGAANGDQVTTLVGGGLHSVANTDISFEGSVVWIRSTDTTDFTVSGTDGLGDTALVVIKDEAQHLTDLPTIAPHGYLVKIVGDATDIRDDYYVRFVADNETFGTGVWEEYRQGGIEYKFDPATMPHVLVRQTDGSFIFDAVDGSDATLPLWGERNCGDAVSNSEPTFVDKKINDIFLFKNRLGFLADENVILSETGEFFNFWRTTVTDLLDTDPIDVSSTHSSVSILTSAIPFSRQLVLFSDQTQFVLQGGNVLTPATVSMTKTTNYESVSDVRPVTIGHSIYFGFNRGDYAGIRQYYLARDNETIFDAADISGQVPQYISGSLRDITGSSHEDILVALTEGDRNSLYVYKFFDQNNARVQSAWSRFKFSSNDAVLGVEFIDTTLYIVVKRADGIFLDKMRLEPGKIDTGSTYRTLLDRRVDEGDCTVSHDAPTGISTVTMPYKAYTNSTIDIITKDGLRIPVATQTNGSNQVTVETNLTGVEFWIGERYEMLYQFSDVVMREQTSGGGEATILAGRAQVRYLTLGFSNTGYFSVEVTPDYRDKSTHPYTGRVLGSGGNILGTVPLEDGDFRVPVYSEASQVTIECKNDTPLPCALTSAEFEMSLNARSQRFS